MPWIKRRNDGESDTSYITRNWLNFTEMSGDHIVEQHVHNLDVAVWFLGRSAGVRARLRRTRPPRNRQHVRLLQRRSTISATTSTSTASAASSPGTYGQVGEMFTGTEGSCYGGGKIKGKDVSIPEIKLDSANSP